MRNNRIKVGILGFGNLGRFIYESVHSNPHLKKWAIAFVWNRSSEILEEYNIPKELRLGNSHLITDLSNFLEENEVDIVIEAAHPVVVKNIFQPVIDHSRLFITSLTAFADVEFQIDITQAVDKGKMIIPTGAGWGFEDIHKMGLMHTLRSVHIDMTFHPKALRLDGPQAESLARYLRSSNIERHLVAEGTVREIGKVAPNNANTMIGLALRSKLPNALDRFTGKLWADKSTHDHKVEICVEGPEGFRVATKRINPAKPGAVTGNMTFSSFLADLILWGENIKQQKP